MSCNTCTICLETVVGSEPIGCVHPCGHVFHQQCWDGWVAAGRHDGHTKCAMCNRQSRAFCRIYLDFSTMLDTNDSDDDLSSCHDNLDDDSQTAQHLTNDQSDTTKSHEEDQNDDADSSQSRSVVVVVDDPDNAVASTHTTGRSSSNAEANDGPDKYRNLAKRFRRQNKQLSAKVGTTCKELTRLQDEARQTKTEIEGLREDLATFEAQAQMLERQTEGEQLRRTQLERRLATAQSLNKSLQSQVETVQTQYSRLQNTHAKALEKARATSMTEVQQMLQDYPKVMNENRELKLQLSRTRTAPPIPTSSSAKRTRNLLSELDRSHNNSNNRPNNNTKARKTVERNTVEMQEYMRKSKSNQASAMMRTFQNNKQKSNRIELGSVLGGGVKKRRADFR